MATTAEPLVAENQETRFFFRMALAIAVTAIFGFGLNAAMGRVDIPQLPFWVHIHAVANMSWMALLVAQSYFIHRSSLAVHRRLGWLGLVLLVAVVGMGLTTTALNVALHRTPPFFSPRFFLMLDGLIILSFAGLAGAGIALRRRTDWHRRLLIGASIILIGPAWGRILPAPMLGDHIGWGVYPALLLYFLVLMLHDYKTREAFHPATLWGVGVLTVSTAAMLPLAATPAVGALVHMLSGA